MHAFFGDQVQEPVVSPRAVPDGQQVSANEFVKAFATARGHGSGGKKDQPNPKGCDKSPLFLHESHLSV
jgi:hypothetical protein